MKIMIVKCSSKDAWYKNSIGKMFRVVGQSGGKYNVITKNPAIKGKDITLAIPKQDCEIVEN